MNKNIKFTNACMHNYLVAFFNVYKSFFFNFQVLDINENKTA